VTLRRAGFEQVLAALWERGVLPDYRRPDGIRIGPAPLSTSFVEVHHGLRLLHDLIRAA
jgi:kynureninase